MMCCRYKDDWCLSDIELTSSLAGTSISNSEDQSINQKNVSMNESVAELN